jgi:hypothetical protein
MRQYKTHDALDFFEPGGVEFEYWVGVEFFEIDVFVAMRQLPHHEVRPAKRACVRVHI